MCWGRTPSSLLHMSDFLSLSLSPSLTSLSLGQCLRQYDAREVRVRAGDVGEEERKERGAGGEQSR